MFNLRTRELAGLAPTFAAILLALLPGWLAAAPKNVILFIGDGMGFEQVKAGGLYAHGATGTLFFESLPHRGEVTTYSANSAVTDSAAAATAIATGVKVQNGVISMAYPGDGGELFTLLEHSQVNGKSTGLVTTTYLTHATPAAFGAHEPSRDRTAQIAEDYLAQSRPDVLLGGGGNGMSVAAAQNAGYFVVEDRAELLAVDAESATRLSGQFGTGHLPYEFDGLGNLPGLSEMTSVALDMLDNNPSGFFVVVEGGRIDHACHNNDIQRAVREVAAFDRAIQTAFEWAQGRDDTLILVTADHETGGLSVISGNGAGLAPTVSWSTTGHTGVNVPIWGWGVGAEEIIGVLDNTEIFDLVIQTSASPASSPSPEDGALVVGSNVSLSWQAGDGAVAHDVYFGFSDPPDFLATTTEPTVTPGPLAGGRTYFWRVDEVGAVETVPGPTWSFTTVLESTSADTLSQNEILVSGTLSNDHTATWVSDGVHEDITEVLAGGGKPANRRSVLDHRWILDVPPGDVVSFHLRAHHTENDEKDDFRFAFSTDDVVYTNLLVVTRTTATDSYQVATLPSDLAGVVFLRVTDTDATKGHSQLDTLRVDHMFVRSAVVLDPPGVAAEPSPRSGEMDVPLTAELTWRVGDGAQGHDVHFGTAPDRLTLLAQDYQLNAYTVGPLEPGQTYYWRVDEVNSHGTTSGEPWQFTTTICSPDLVSVESIRLFTQRGTRGRSYGIAVVEVRDGCGQPSEGALVTGHFTGDFAAEATESRRTTADGTATFQTAQELKKPTFSFTVDDVTR